MSPATGFLVGLVGSTHCLGMCGGLAAASSAPRRYLVRAETPPAMLGLTQHLARATAYALLGAVAGMLGGVVDHGLAEVGRVVLQVLALLVLLSTAANLLGWLPPQLSLERLGGPLWQRVAPRARALLPVRTMKGAVAFGALWGLLPCGIVYSALALAAALGDPFRGAALMLAFGLGTMPALLGVGALAARLTRLPRWPRVAGIGALAFAGLQLVTLVRGGIEPRICCTSSAVAAWLEQAP